MDNKVNLQQLQNFYNNLVQQYTTSLQIPKLEAKLKVGTLVLYFYAYSINDSELQEKLKAEAQELFDKVGNFFSEAESDLNKMKIERPDLAEMFTKTTHEEYDLLVKYIQDDILISRKK